VFADIRVLNSGTNQLEIRAFEGGADEASQLVTAVGKGITGWVTQNKTPLYVPDVSKDARYRAISKLTRSELVVPMLDEDRLIGVLNIERPKVNGFSDTDIKLAEVIAQLAVVAYQNITRFRQLKNSRQNRTLAIGKMAESITAVSQGVRETLRGILEWVGVLTASEMDNLPPCLIEIFTCDKQTQALERQGVWPGAIDRPPASLESPIFKWVIETRSARIIQDVLDAQDDPPASPLDERTRSQLVVPIVRNGEVHGIINVEHLSVGVYSADFSPLAIAMANLAMVAIDRARQYEEIEKHKRLIGSRTALVWLNLASTTWYHSVRRDAVLIRDAIFLAKQDYEQNHLPDSLVTCLNEINDIAKDILDKKEKMLHDLTTNVAPSILKPLLEKQLEWLKVDKVKADVQFRADLSGLDDSVVVQLNAEWLKVVFETLIDNAKDAMKESVDKQITFTAKREGENVEIDLADTGKGMPPEIVDALSSGELPQPGDSNKGLGIGLLVAQVVVEAFGGSIRVKDTSEQGTTMAIYLPIDKNTK
jgi:GAF domain-containing protein